jgi:hypothetical protein
MEIVVYLLFRKKAITELFLIARGPVGSGAKVRPKRAFYLRNYEVMLILVVRKHGRSHFIEIFQVSKSKSTGFLLNKM